MRHCTIAAFALSLLLPFSAFADTIDVSTGSSVQAGLDQRYTVVYNGGYSAANATPQSGGASAFAIDRNPAWTEPAAGTSWIGPDAGSASSSTDAGGFYTYTTTLVLNGDDHHDLSGSFAADNLATIFLNGVNTGVMNYSFAVPSSFEITSGFVDGLNTLQFVVQNGDGGGDTVGPTGLYTAAQLSSTPEPASLVLLGTGAISMLGAGRRRLTRR